MRPRLRHFHHRTLANLFPLRRVKSWMHHMRFFHSVAALHLTRVVEVGQPLLLGTCHRLLSRSCEETRLAKLNELRNRRTLSAFYLALSPFES